MVHMVLLMAIFKVKSYGFLGQVCLYLCHQFSGMNPMVRMILSLEVLKRNSYGSQYEILLVDVPSILMDESYGAYISLASGSLSQILLVVVPSGLRY